MNNIKVPDFKRAVRLVNVLYSRTLPMRIAAEAELFFKESFRSQGFIDKMLRPWKVTKKGKKSYLGHSSGILIGSGALMRSIRTVKQSEGIVHISAGNEHVPYAQIHNEGFDGTEGVKAHQRKTRKGSVSVRAFTRHMVMPQRQFMGDSSMLSDNIDKIIIREITALERNLFNS
jgi:phage gpG-like protein